MRATEDMQPAGWGFLLFPKSDTATRKSVDLPQSEWKRPLPERARWSTCLHTEALTPHAELQNTKAPLKHTLQHSCIMQCLPGGETEPQTHFKAHFTSGLSLACVPGLCVFHMAPLSEGPPFLYKSHDLPSTVLTQLPIRAHCCCLLGPHRSTRTFIIHFPPLATW